MGPAWKGTSGRSKEKEGGYGGGREEGGEQGGKGC
jgi:hypothetical protein